MVNVTQLVQLGQAREFDLSPEQFLADPFPILREMSQQSPVYWSEEIQAWFLTSYEGVVAAFQDPRFSSDRARIAADKMAKSSGEQNHPEKPPKAIENFVRVLSGMMFVKDGEEHRRLRKPLNQALRHELMPIMTEAIHQAADEALAAVMGLEKFDVVNDFAAAYSLTVLCKLMGVPIRDRDDIRQWTMDYATFLGSPEEAKTETAAIQADQAVCKFEAYFGDIISRPIEDIDIGLIREFVERAAEAGLSKEELISQFVMLTSAGNAPIIDQIGNTMRLILERPEVYALLRQQPELIGAASREGLRHDPATFIAHRYASEDIEIDDQKIKQGDVVFLCIGAANHDKNIFEEPEKFDPLRSNAGKNLTFGAGIHHCFGTVLANSILTEGLDRLITGLPPMMLEGEPQGRYNTYAFRGYSALPVRVIPDNDAQTRDSR